MKSSENKLQTQSIDKPKTLFDKISKAGNLNEIAFARKVVEFDKIKDIENLGDGLGLLFTQINNILGIKTPINDINKLDIKEMLLKRFKTISLEEIDYAFKLERYGVLGTRTEHYQLFNAQYVSDILGKYKDWLQEIRRVNNLPLSKIIPMKEMSEKDKELLVIQGVINCFDEFIQTNDIINGYTWVYDHLDELNLFEYTTKQKKDKMLVAESKLRNQANNITDMLNRKEILKTLENKNDQSIKNEAKRLLLKDYFAKLQVKDKHIKEFI